MTFSLELRCDYTLQVAPKFAPSQPREGVATPFVLAMLAVLPSALRCLFFADADHDTPSSVAASFSGISGLCRSVRLRVAVGAACCLTRHEFRRGDVGITQPNKEKVVRNVERKIEEKADEFQYWIEDLPEEELDRLEREYIEAQKADNDNDTVSF